MTLALWSNLCCVAAVSFVTGYYYPDALLDIVVEMLDKVGNLLDNVLERMGGD